EGRIGKLKLQTPAMIHFGEETEDEVYISYSAATSGVVIENTGTDGLVGLRYFGLDTHENLPAVGDYKRENGSVRPFIQRRQSMSTASHNRDSTQELPVLYAVSRETYSAIKSALGPSSGELEYDGDRLVLPRLVSGIKPHDYERFLDALGDL